ncbi:T9SS type A sorting domain-containing protein [uncultured Polaribacter sp.]|uniref:T9SS type A sorting domain-containing protein n=1 Tax=uncultured Polaribacter sp. TaxID=174711 RepID=UPI002631C6BE|nr:T9SS type A sorting domain-containing protein [uncultured Polaribacter sp.]
MKKNLHKLLFVALLVSSSAIFSQITVEVETGTVAGGDGTTALVGSENGGTNNVLTNVRKSSGAEVTITNSVTIATAGNYDFTLTYYKGGASGTANDNTLEFRADGVLKFTHELAKNLSPDGTATTASYGTVTISNIALLAGTYNIELRAKDPKSFNIDNYIISETPPNPTMTANQSGDWDDSAIWTISGAVANTPSTTPTAEYDVIIPDTFTITVDMPNQAANSIKVTDDANLIVSSGGALSVTGDVFLGRFDGGLVVQNLTAAETMGTITIGGSVHTLDGDDTTTSASDKRLLARRTLTNDKWYLLSSISSKQPRVNRMTDSDFRTNATPAYSIAVYSNTNSVGSKYDYFSTTLTNSDEVTLGAGMSVSVNGTGNANTTGEFEYKAFYSHTADVTRSISADTGGTGDDFNMVGNPFLANIYGNNNANANNVLTENTGILEEATLWFWNEAGNGGAGAWVTRNQSSAAFTIPPLTGFFVRSSAAGGNFTFKENMETHTVSGNITAAKNGKQRFEIDLSVNNGSLKSSTSIKFINNMTTSFDNGYDSSIFGGYASELEVFTNLVEGGSAKKLAIQSLPNENFEDMIVPVGVTAAANSEITFTLEALNIPTGYNVSLEDRASNTFTRLDEEGAKYTTTVTDKSTEGRFYIHTRSKALSVGSELLNSVSIYKSNASTLRIVGLSEGNTNVKLYNLLGKQVMSSNFNTTGVKELSLPKLSKGVYIVKLETETGKLNKKIVLE